VRSNGSDAASGIGVGSWLDVHNGSTATVGTIGKSGPQPRV